MTLSIISTDTKEENTDIRSDYPKKEKEREEEKRREKKRKDKE
jgi:hypothetical protein